MFYEYLNDASFLKQIDLLKIKEQYIKISVLDWNEKLVQDIEGKATGGSVNIDGTSAVRRTANINLAIDEKNNDLTNLENFISLNKKVDLYVGVKNSTNQYLDYDIIWYPLGRYIITQASLSHSNSGITANIQMKDKMCLLNGEIGGVFPAAINLSEVEYYNEKGEVEVKYLTIYQIIQELVHHWGGEQLGKIIISDIDTKIKKVMKWIGDAPLYQYHNGESIMYTTQEKIASSYSQYKIFEYGEDVGYIYSDFYYAKGELTANAGGNICEILDQIKNLLGNYEYFYDINGNFVFQEIKNYLNKSFSSNILDNINTNSAYVIDQKNGKSVYSFDDNTLLISCTNNPQYQMIKNDFIVWGKRTSVEGLEVPIRYHLAIDKKPEIGNNYNIIQYEDEEDGLTKSIIPMKVSTLPKTGVIGVIYDKNGIFYKWNPITQDYDTLSVNSINIQTKDWRTELYLQGNAAEPFGTESNYYYTELKNEWNRIYDIPNGKFFTEIKKTPSNMNFYLDFIDSFAPIGQFSVSNIGRRTKVVSDDSINCIFPPEIPDLIIIEEGENSAKEREEAIKRGQNFTQVDSAIYNSLVGGGNLNSAYDCIRDLLYQYTSYNENVSIQSLPVFHLDVNTRMSINNYQANINGDYIIKSISIPLDINGNMTINANKAIERF